MDSEVNDSFKKLKFLLSNPPSPPKTYGNILLLYCKHGYNHLAADILPENSYLTYDMLPQEIHEYLDAAIMLLPALTRHRRSLILFQKSI